MIDARQPEILEGRFGIVITGGVPAKKAATSDEAIALTKEFGLSVEGPNDESKTAGPTVSS